MLNRESIKATIREYFKSICIALFAAMLIKIFVIESYAIPTGSMKNTLLVGDVLMANKFVYGVRTPNRIPIVDFEIPYFKLPAFRQPQRGDIVIFKYPKDDKLNYVKRCIALPGQTVEIKHGDVYVDGKIEGRTEFLKRAYDAEEGTSFSYYQVTLDNGATYTIRHFENFNSDAEHWGPVKVPEGHYFMMGDNRDNSADSRFWGFLPAENILGKPLIIYFSWDKNIPFYRTFHKIRWSRLAKLIS